jgi:hypothetical protein
MGVSIARLVRESITAHIGQHVLAIGDVKAPPDQAAEAAALDTANSSPAAPIEASARSSRTTAADRCTRLSARPPVLPTTSGVRHAPPSVRHVAPCALTAALTG